eukprot:4814222-Prymnesium_polylepis.1
MVFCRIAAAVRRRHNAVRTRPVASAVLDVHITESTIVASIETFSPRRRHRPCKQEFHRYLNHDSDDEWNMIERYETQMRAQGAKSRKTARLARPPWEPPPTECSFDTLQSWHGLSRDASRILCPFCNTNASAAHFCGLSSDGSSHIARHAKQLRAIGERYQRLATYVRLVIQYCSPYHRKMPYGGCQEKPGQWR